MSSADLIAALRAALDEDDLTVREANTSPEMVTGIPRSYVKAPVAIYIGRFADPARVLADIAAKRAILDLHDSDHECSTRDRNGDIDNCTWVMGGETCTTLQLLAEAYGITA